MALLELILIVVLQFEGIRGREVYLYYSTGNNVILPCDHVPSHETCSFTWLYNRNNTSETTVDVYKGNIQKNSARAGRLSLYSNCSLAINNITAEDAGRYICRRGTTANEDTSAHLNILSISPTPTDADPKRDGDVTLRCSLLRFSSSCRQDNIRWVDETGAVLPGKSVGGQPSCVSVLTVKRQSGHNKRYTCQYVAGDVKIETHYPPDFTDSTSNETSIIIGAVVGVGVVLVVIAAVLFKCRRRAKVTEDVQKPTQPNDEPEVSLTYITVNHANQKAKIKVKEEEERVTYSTVKTEVKPVVDNDPSSFYSYAG